MMGRKSIRDEWMVKTKENLDKDKEAAKKLMIDADLEAARKLIAESERRKKEEEEKRKREEERERWEQEENERKMQEELQKEQMSENNEALLRDNIEMAKKIEKLKKEAEEAKMDTEELRQKIGVGIFKWSKVKRKPVRYEDPILLEIREDGYVDVIEKVKPGEMRLKMSNGKEVIANLDPKRSVRIPDGFGDEYRAFIHYEKEMGCYPLDVSNDMKVHTDILTSLQHNYKDLDMIDKLGGFINLKSLRALIMIGIVAVMVGVILMMYWPQISGAFGGIVPQAQQQSVQTVT